ncbi:MAG: patatin-like phospholipase family protein [Candidatus Latescibacteria bacterium]|nr:patatin-like phospholipase family protein [Candidatus Latescibacterota bacterium]
MRILFLTFLAVLICINASADTFSITYENGKVVKRYPEHTRPVIGLALSGGGARGIAHIGVLQALENMGIRIERIAGTSMGSIVGGLYAAGYSTEYLANTFENTDWGNYLSSSPHRRSSYVSMKEVYDWPLFELRFDGFKAKIPSSLSSGQHFTSVLSWLCLGPTFECQGDFDKLHIPFRAISTNLNTGSKAILSHGSLARAIQASSTIPLLFTPVPWGNMLLVDGGIVDNLPVTVVREMGCDFVIASAVEESMHPVKDLDNAINIADNVTSIPMRNMTRLSKNLADFVISPDMDNFSSTDFDQIPEMIEQGRQAMLDAIPALKDTLDKMSSTFHKIELRSVKVSPKIDEQVVLTELTPYLSFGKSIYYADIADGLEALWATGKYSSIIAVLDAERGLIELELNPIPVTIVIMINGRNQDEIINKTLGITNDANKPLLIHDIIEQVDSNLRAVRSEGFSFAYISGTDISQSHDRMVITITVPQLTDIVIDKNIKSRNSLILREFDMKTGDTFDLNKVMTSVENLYGTNLFEWVYADVEQYDNGVRLYFHLSEKKLIVSRFGLRYDEFNHTKGRIALSKENVLGFGNRTLGTMQLGERTRLLLFEIQNDRIYKSYYTYSIKAYKNYRLRALFENHSHLSDYEDDRYGVIFSIGQQMDKLGNAMLQFKSETLWLNMDPSLPLKGNKKELRSIVISSLIDSYDRYPFPQNGMLNQIYIETTAEILGGTEQFVKLFWGSSHYRTLARKHTFSGSFFLGTADPSIPEIESFTLGGAPSRLNCYDPESSGSHLYADFIGLAPEEKFGNRLAVAATSYRLFIPKYFFFNLIYSIGNVWQQSDKITSDSLLQSYGVKASFSSYGGPISIGWGITSKGDDRLYLSAGWEF